MPHREGCLLYSRPAPILIKEEILEMEAKQKALFDSVNKLAAIPIREGNEETKNEWKAQVKESRAVFNQMFDADMDEEQEEDEHSPTMLSVVEEGDRFSAEIESRISDAQDKSMEDSPKRGRSIASVDSSHRNETISRRRADSVDSGIKRSL